MGLNLSSLVLMGVFLIHLAVQVQAISYTPLSPGWAPAVKRAKEQFVFCCCKKKQAICTKNQRANSQPCKIL